MTEPAQVVVIGAGPGGYVAAFAAADEGLSVTLISEEPRLGGVCLLRGCIPSKALLHVARLIHESRESAEWGVAFQEPKIDLDRLRAWKTGITTRLTDGIAQLAKARKVRVLSARARFADSHTLALTPSDGARDVPATLSFERCILASGSRPVVPKSLAVDDPRVMTSRIALDLPDVPERLLVVGGGYIGLEMGTVYEALGSRVTVVELLDGLLPGADRDLVKPLAARLAKSFEAIYLKTKLESLEPAKDGIVARFSGEGAPPQATFDRVLIAVGRRPNSADLGLENTKVVVDEKGFVKVAPNRQTDDPAIYAIGDVAGEPMLAHKAMREAKVVAEVIAGKKTVFDAVAIPAVVFTDPEIAWCGLTETEAKAKGVAYKTARFPWTALGRAMTLGRTEGLTKLVFDPATERLLGVGIVGVNAGDLISEGALAVEMAALARDVGETIHPHPTLSETVMEAAENFFGASVHMARPRR